MKFNQTSDMERYMIHLKNTKFLPKDASSLLRKSRDLTKGMSVTIRDSRVSSRYVEFDVSINQDELDKFIGFLEPIGSLDHAKHVVEESIDKEDAIDDGIFYFNTERFWECHEVLEGVWNKCYEGEKDLVQGIILVAAALVHYQKNENDICISIFERALKKLANTSGMYHKINVDDLRDNVQKMLVTRKISTFEI